MATTMAPRPPRPSNNPPKSALPPIPKMRKASQSPPAIRSTVQTPQKGELRTPSSSSMTTTLPKAKFKTLPTTKMALPDKPNGVGATKIVRKQIGIHSFPQPPKNVRTSSLPSTPLSMAHPPAAGSAERLTAGQRTFSDSATSRVAKPGMKRKTSTTPFARPGQATTPLDGIDEGTHASAGPGSRESAGLLSNPSPPQSRSSSAQGSYSTSATNYDEMQDGTRGRPLSSETTGERDSLGESKGNVLVSVRVRPDASGNDKSTDGEWTVDGRKSLVSYNGKESGDYFYDNVFAPQDNNARVYDSLAKRLVRRVMEGYHGTVFAYGMTGTGKTFSMQGTGTSPGVIPLAITDIFSYIRETPSREFLLRVSYLEIYNEKIHDLLNESSGATNGEEIKLREDVKRGVYATPLKEEIVQSPTQLLRVIARGDQARRTSSTQFNSRSSRSHAVVQIVVESRERGATGLNKAGDKRSTIVPGGVRVSTLSLIDLAGSERAAENKERRTEGAHINKSLLTLGTVIARLSGDKDKDGKPTDKDGKHLPYRDSKLTRLLQGALSGDSLVSILCTISIGNMGSASAMNTHTNETLNTLKFASRAKNNIVSHAKKADEGLGAGGEGGARVLLERYRLEIQELRAQIENQIRPLDDEEKQREKEAEIRHEEQILEMQLARTALKERIEHLNRLIISSQSIGVNGRHSSMSNQPRVSSMTSNSQLGFSSRLSIARSEASRRSLQRSVSINSSSTLSRLPNRNRDLAEKRTSSGGRSLNSDRSGENHDGDATLSQQNRALQTDLADKTRYISTLEQRLLQARRSSQSRASITLQQPVTKPLGMNDIMVGEDHGVATLLKDKDSEIAELRASLEDKERMLAALRCVTRSRQSSYNTSALSSPALTSSPPQGLVTQERNRNSSDYELERLSPTKGLVELKLLTQKSCQTTEGTRTAARGSVKRVRNVDEMSKMLDEMIQDKVEQGLLVKNKRGSIRVAKRDSSFGPVTRFSSGGARISSNEKS